MISDVLVRFLKEAEIKYITAGGGQKKEISCDLFRCSRNLLSTVDNCLQ